jgi:hypothetical protein
MTCYFSLSHIDPWLLLGFVCGMRNSGREVVALTVVDLMRRLRDGVLVWQIRVKTLGSGYWSEPVMSMSYAFLKASLKVKLLAPPVTSKGNPRSLVIR